MIIMKKEIDTLIKTFEKEAISRYQALLKGDSRRANSHFRKMHKAFLEILESGQEGQDALLQLIYSAEDAIALEASGYSLEYDPEESLKVLKRLSGLPGYIGLCASQALKHWKAGTWKPIR